MDLADSSRQTDDSDPNSEFKRGIPHDVLAVYGPLIKVPKVSLKEHKEEQIRGEAMPDPSSPNPTPTRLFLNGAITPSEANHLIDEGLVDAVVFGTLWIGNPDLQKRIEGGLDVGAGINAAPNTKTFYQAPSGNPHEGYTDYKTSALA
jgi:2,4-dienoyl-CoA reductase-like NADH-dependent reductase (Old Yellow Enzyme family)